MAVSKLKRPRPNEVGSCKEWCALFGISSLGEAILFLFFLGALVCSLVYLGYAVTHGAPVEQAPDDFNKSSCTEEDLTCGCLSLVLTNHDELTWKQFNYIAETVHPDAWFETCDPNYYTHNTTIKLYNVPYEAMNVTVYEFVYVSGLKEMYVIPDNKTYPLGTSKIGLLADACPEWKKTKKFALRDGGGTYMPMYDFIGCA